MFALVVGVAWPCTMPNFFAGRRVQSRDGRPAAMQKLQVKPAVIEHGSRSHAKLNVEFAVLVLHVVLPNLVAIDRVAAQLPGPHESPDVLAIGRGGRRSHVSFIAT